MNIETEEYSWYGMKIHLIDKMASDTVYTLEWGLLKFYENFQLVNGTLSSVVLNNTEYLFIVNDENTAKIKEKTTILFEFVLKNFLLLLSKTVRTLFTMFSCSLSVGVSVIVKSLLSLTTVENKVLSITFVRYGTVFKTSSFSARYVPISNNKPLLVNA